MAHKGWISVHRSLLDHHFWGCEKFTKGQAWVDLILNANHKEKKALIKGQLIKVERGQQIRSQVTLAKTWKWDRKTVHRFLNLLESDLMIVQDSTHLTTVITICNYSKFQDIEKDSPHLKGQVEGQVSGQTVPKCRGTNNNVNNGDNANNDNKKKGCRLSLTELPDEWKLFCNEERPDLIPETVFEIFKDYWAGISGAKGVKLDWLATWRNWVRRQNKETAKADKHGGFDKKDYQAGATDISKLGWMNDE